MLAQLNSIHKMWLSDNIYEIFLLNTTDLRASAVFIYSWWRAEECLLTASINCNCSATVAVLNFPSRFFDGWLFLHVAAYLPSSRQGCWWKNYFMGPPGLFCSNVLLERLHPSHKSSLRTIKWAVAIPVLAADMRDFLISLKARHNWEDFFLFGGVTLPKYRELNVYLPSVST